MKTFKTSLIAAVLGIASVTIYAQAPDNTAVNKRDRSAAEPTADQQKQNKGDVDLTKNIRRALMDDKALSTYAHNVKVISQNGTVTLKGPVKSDEEKRTVVAKATSVAGSSKVVDELSVK